MDKSSEIVNLAARRKEREAAAKKLTDSETEQVFQYECPECACGFFRVYDDGSVECADCGEYNPEICVFEPDDG